MHKEQRFVHGTQKNVLYYTVHVKRTVGIAASLAITEQKMHQGVFLKTDCPRSESVKGQRAAWAARRCLPSFSTEDREPCAGSEGRAFRVEPAIDAGFHIIHDDQHKPSNSQKRKNGHFRHCCHCAIYYNSY